MVVQEVASLDSHSQDESSWGLDVSFRQLWRSRRFLAAVVMVSTMTATGVAFLLPKTFESRATILPTTNQDGSGLLGSVTEQLGPMMGLLRSSASGRSSDLMEFLTSGEFIDRLIVRCDLRTRIKGWVYHSALQDRVSKMLVITSPTPTSKIITIKARAEDPGLSQAMASASLDVLKSMLDEAGYLGAVRSRRFLEARLAKAQDDLGRAESELATVQANRLLPSLPETVQLAMKAIGDLEVQQVEVEAQRKATDLAYDTLREKVRSLQADPAQLTELEIKRKSLEAQSRELKRVRERYSQRLKALPPAGLSLVRRQREVQVQNAVYLSLRQQYQAALIAEAKDSDAFLVLDHPQLPELPVAPNKRLLIALGAMGGLVIGSLITLLRLRTSSFLRTFSGD